MMLAAGLRTIRGPSCRPFGTGVVARNIPPTNESGRLTPVEPPALNRNTGGSCKALFGSAILVMKAAHICQTVPDRRRSNRSSLFVVLALARN